METIMNIIDEILKKFTTQISYCKWLNTPEGRFLSIELNTHDLKEVNLITKEINNFIDEIDTNVNYYLDIFSKGIDLNIPFDELNNYIDKKIEITLNQPYKDKKVIEIILKENKIDELFGKINNKGQFQKIYIKKDNINKIQKVIFN
ncbi:hypothetical protein [Mycoplasma miroungirhinis]|uniref:Ribosome maturation factor RimP n=1 Tax=Mycoplasma miroungirhinis TaxID=754516 RepID=A0A6M4JDW5_9MOLU|nr:hypothetical protein [Mycoplasma miroungirhinis]QJR44277.1 hypothetical protein HLA92_02435 [Mycoplasma miroungirhinis]